MLAGWLVDWLTVVVDEQVIRVCLLVVTMSYYFEYEQEEKGVVRGEKEK